MGPVGDWNEDRNGKWIWDPAAPTPGQDPAVTQLLNIVTYPATHTPSTNGSDVDPTLMPPEDQHQHGGDE